MKILIVDRATIPVKLYGGTERVTWYLGNELARLGHEVTYLVGTGSRAEFAKVIPLDPEKQVSGQIPEDIDLVHFNSFIPHDLGTIQKPVVITQQGNINDQRELHINTVFVSKNHASRYGSESFVHNGIDWEDYTKPSLSESRTYFHFLGNAAWRLKNVKGAIDLIKKTRSETIHILGGVRFNLKMGVRLTFTGRARFHGMVGGQEKDRLLQHSKGLVFPVLWHEPFGIAITESLYFGCPVFATPYGSLSEIVTPEVGFLSNRKSELQAAIESVDQYSNRRCHEYACEKFNSRIMALRYLDRYQRVLSGQTLNEVPPKLQKVQREKFLDWLE